MSTNKNGVKMNNYKIHLKIRKFLSNHYSLCSKSIT